MNNERLVHYYLLKQCLRCVLPHKNHKILPYTHTSGLDKNSNHSHYRTTEESGVEIKLNYQILLEDSEQNTCSCIRG